MQIKKGRYRHFKGGEYMLLDVARHSESGEYMALYRPFTAKAACGCARWICFLKMWKRTVFYSPDLPLYQINEKAASAAFLISIFNIFYTKCNYYKQI